MNTIIKPPYLPIDIPFINHIPLYSLQVGIFPEINHPFGVPPWPWKPPNGGFPSTRPVLGQLQHVESHPGAELLDTCFGGPRARQVDAPGRLVQITGDRKGPSIGGLIWVSNEGRIEVN